MYYICINKMKQLKLNDMTILEFKTWAKSKSIDLVNEFAGFKTGDKVIYTNDYGVKFQLEVKGFNKKSIEKQERRTAYIFDDAYWFEADVTKMKLIS